MDENCEAGGIRGGSGCTGAIRRVARRNRSRAFPPNGVGVLRILA